MGGMLQRLLLTIVTMLAVLAAGSAAPAVTDEEDCTRSESARGVGAAGLVHGSGICWNAGLRR